MRYKTLCVPYVLVFLHAICMLKFGHKCTKNAEALSLVGVVQVDACVRVCVGVVQISHLVLGAVSYEAGHAWPKVFFSGQTREKALGAAPGSNFEPGSAG